MVSEICYHIATSSAFYIPVAAVFILTAFLGSNGRYRWIYIFAKTYRRDIRLIRTFISLNFKLWLWGKQNKTVIDLFSVITQKYPNKVAFFFENEAWTFSQVDDFSNQIAQYFTKQGFRKGDSVGLLLESRPEYVSIWLGLSKIGVVTALINTNLVRSPLLHSINVAKCKSIIFGSNFGNVIKDISSELNQLKLFQFHESVRDIKDVIPNAVALRLELENCSTLAVDNYQASITDPLLHIYTSGTTGLPKAALITHARYLFLAWAMHLSVKIRPNDVIYSSLPLYHGAGGMLGVGQTLIAGTTLAIRKKFSATNYWKDCARYKCTVAQYIGEMCRYILSAHEDPVKHPVRAMYGNGLRPQIWEKFVNKFNIKEMYEVYGATEGISNMINMDNTMGSVGFVPRYLRFAYPVKLVKRDMNTGDPIRGEDGRCIECGVNEPGLVVGKILPKKAMFSFKGYSDEEATEQKILKDVFRPGDLYFNSGDILVEDELGNFFFKDRTGDTFRWKGENVSTAEVEAVISNTVQLNDAVVFGVEVPEREGKAGMVAIVNSDNTLNVDLLGSALKSNLPFYAIPVFLRVMESVPLTGTYKLKKVELQLDGYNINKFKDSVYFYNAKQGKYVLLTKEMYKQIVAGKMNI